MDRLVVLQGVITGKHPAQRGNRLVVGMDDAGHDLAGRKLVGIAESHVFLPSALFRKQADERHGSLGHLG